MSKYLILSMLLFAPFSSLHAQNTLTDVGSQLADVGDSAYGTTGGPSKDLTQTIGYIINVILGLLGIIFLILLIYAGFLWMTAGGESDKVDKAKQILSTSIIGLVIVLAAYAISAFVVEELTKATTGTESSVQ